MTQVLGVNGFHLNAVPTALELVRKMKAGTYRKAKSLGTWLLMEELAYMGHYLCGLDERTSTSIGGSRNTLDPRKPKP